MLRLFRAVRPGAGVPALGLLTGRVRGLLAGGAVRGSPLASIAISVVLHAGLLAMLALTLSSVARHGSGEVLSLDLALGEAQAEAFEASAAVQPAPDQADQANQTAQASDAETRMDASQAVAAALARIESADVAMPEGPTMHRGSANSSGTGAGEGGSRSEVSSLLDRGGPGGWGLAELSDANSTLDAASFAGVSARRATSVVYAVDASGAMITSLPFVLDELRRSVSALAADQRFAVVLFGRRMGDDDAAGVRVFPESGLAPGTQRSKAELLAWLEDVQARGVSNPLDGLLVALQREPEVVFLLSRSIRRTDGREAVGDWGPGREAILAELDHANPVRSSIFGRPTRAVQVKCVQFLEEDPTGVMRAIAEVHGGGPESYRLLLESELRRR